MSGPQRLSAISKALMVTCRSFTALTAHPTMNRENRSKTAARYSLPLLPMTNSVVSPTPPLIRGVRLELAVEQIRRDRLVVIAHGGYFVTLPGPCDQACFLHQPDDPFATHLLVLLDQVFVNARAAIALFARVTGRLDEDLQPPVVS